MSHLNGWSRGSIVKVPTALIGFFMLPLLMVDCTYLCLFKLYSNFDLSESLGLIWEGALISIHVGYPFVYLNKTITNRGKVVTFSLNQWVTT